MNWLWLCLAIALVGEGIELTGFDRLHVDPALLVLQPQQARDTEPDQWLTLTNGNTARATVRIGDHAIGEMLPHAQARIGPIPAGSYRVHFELPGDVVRIEDLQTQPIDAR
jgi:hypothetical protein